MNSGAIFEKNGHGVFGLSRPYSDFHPQFQVTPLQAGVVRIGAGMLNGKFVSPAKTRGPTKYDKLNRAWICIKARVTGDLATGYSFRGISYTSSDPFLTDVETRATAMRAFKEEDEFVSYYPIAMFRSNGEFHQIVNFPLNYMVGEARYDGVSRIGGISHYWFAA